MTLSRQLINLAGGLAVVVILALGILLVALPTFNQARATEQQADEIAGTNDVYDIQVETLRGQQTQLGDLERQLAALRAQIPATPLNDEVFALIGEAVDTTGVFVETITAADAETWLPPSADPEGTDATAAAPDAASTDSATTDATATTPTDGATDPAADPNATADGTATAEGTTATETPAPVEVDPRQMVPFTLVVTLGDAAQAARFLDALRDDDRLLTIEQAVLTEEEGELRLTVNARSLVLLQK